MRFIVHKRGYRLLPVLALALAVSLVMLVSRGSFAESDVGPFEIDGFPDPAPAGSQFFSYYSGNDAPPADDWADGDGLGGTEGVFKLNTGGTPFASCYGSDVDLNGGYSPDTTRFICDGFTGLDIGKPENNIVSPSGDIPDDLWPITTANNLTPKDDLSHGYFLLEKQPCTGEDDHTIVIVGMERGNNEGANHWGIELNQVPPTGLATIADGVPPAANFALDFNRMDGDVFISVELERGGTEPTITVTQVDGTPLQGDPATFILATPTACPDYASNRTSTNLVEQVAPPWNIFSCDPTAADGGTNSCRIANQTGTGLAAGECGTNQNPLDCTRLAPRDFVEVAIDITAYGLAAECFADVILTTRSAPPGGVDPTTGEVDLSGADVKDIAGDFLDVCRLAVDKTGDTLSKVGDPADYSITVQNAGSVDLYMDDITDTLFGSLVVNGVVQAPVAPVTAINVPAGCAVLTPDDGAPGGTDECTITVTRTVQALDPDPLPNTVTVVYNSNVALTGTAVSSTDGHEVNLFQPSITFDKTGDTVSKVGDSVDYTITLTNTSSADTPDLDCTITDALLGINDNVTLAAGDPAYVINTSRVVQPGDPDPLTNTANVSCNVTGFSNVLTDSDGHSVDLFQPAIAVDKTGDTLSKVGDDVNYTITLSNNSSADTPALTCTATDSLLGVVYGPAVLPLGDTVLNESRTVLAGDPDPLTNTVTLNCSVAGFPNVLEVSDGHSVELFQPSITFDKTGDTLSKVGDDVDYTITLNNTSSVDTPDLECTITDALLGVNENVTLASGASHVINTTYTVQAGDPDPLLNTANVSCSPVGFPNILTASDGHSVELFQPAIDADKTGDTLSKIGDPVDYTITLSNNSSADTPALTCTATDSLLGVVFGPAVLPLGDTVLNESRNVQAGDPDPLTNTVTLTCSPAGFPNVLEASDNHSVDLFGPTITFDKTGDTLSKVGDDVDYTITLNNTSSADTPDLECTITDALLGVNENVTLASGASHVINATRTVVAGDPDPLVNTANVTCSPIGFPNILTASDDHSVNLFQPAVDVDKTGDTLSKVGDDVDYTITLSNNSSADTPALDCTAIDSLLGNIYDGILPLGDTVINTSRTVLAGDPDPLTNTVTLTCSPAGFPNVLEASDGHSVELFQPSITFDKTGDTLSKVGDDVDYTITLNNTSSVDTPDLECTITDALLGVNENVTLASGGSHVINATRTVVAGDPDPLVNTANVTCSPIGFPNILEASDGHSVNLFQPSITFDKTGDTLSKVGDDVDYTITLNNTSSVDTPDLECTITDALLGVNENVTLASGGSHVINATRTVVAGDPDPLVNTANVTCSPIGFPNILTDSDDHSVNLFQPSIDLDKTGDELSKVTDSVDYTITLDNTSSVDTPDLDCTITDVLLGVNENVTLASGASHVINTSRVVQAGDPDPLTNTANVSCSPDGFPNILTDSDGHSVELFQPSITFDKTGDTLSKVGDDVDYTITLNNTSSADTPDLECTITDALLSVNENVTLASGASHVINVTRTVQAGDPDPLVNTANVTCSPVGFPNILTANDDHSVNLFQPAVDVEKECDDFAKFPATAEDAAGLNASDDIRCTITITNESSGDSPDLVNGSAIDTLCGDLLGTMNASCAPVSNTCTDTLATGASCEIVYDFDGAAVGSTPDPITNMVTVHYNPDGFPNDITDNDTETIDVLHPDYTILKDCLTDEVPLGGSAIFQVDFQNTGDTDLTVTADEDMTTIPGGVLVPAGTPFSLPVGVTKSFEVSLIATSGPIITNVVNASATLPVSTGLTNVLNRTAEDFCTVIEGATRTPGFWQTHLDYTCHIFEDHLGGSIDLGWKTLDSCSEVFGMFWANNARESDGDRRPKVCQAQVIGSFQLLAAILNTGLDNGAAVPIDPVTGLDLITAMQNALAAGDFHEIKRLGGLLDAYNNSGDDIAIIDLDGTPHGRANPKGAKSIADYSIADCQ